MPREPIRASTPASQDDAHPHVKSGPKGGQFAPKGSDTGPAPAKTGAERGTWKNAPDSRSSGGGRPAPKAADVAAAPVIKNNLTRKGPNDPAEVKALQQMLSALKIGPPMAQDGEFGQRTEEAVKALQEKLGVHPTGHVSPVLGKRLQDAITLSPCVKASAATVSLVMAGAGPLGGSMVGVELARPGTWHLSTGKRTFEPQDLQDAADFFAASGQTRIPIGFGHSDPRFDGDPAFGWVSNIRYTTDAKGPVLLGDLVDLDDWVAAAAPKRWPNRSIEGFANLDWNGRVYRLALTRLALLGSTPPAMPILRSLADLRQAVAAAAAATGAEFVSAAAPPPEPGATTDPAAEAVVVPTSPKKETGMDPAKFREALGLEDASDDEVMEALAQAGFVPASTPPTEEAPVAASGATTVAGIPPGTIVLASSVWDETQTTIRNLTSFVEKAERNERDAVIAQAVKDGKFTPAQRPHFVKLWDADPKGTRAVIDSLHRNSALAVAASGYAGASDEELDNEFKHLFPPSQEG